MGDLTADPVIQAFHCLFLFLRFTCVSGLTSLINNLEYFSFLHPTPFPEALLTQGTKKSKMSTNTENKECEEVPSRPNRDKCFLKKKKSHIDR